VKFSKVNIVYYYMPRLVYCEFTAVDFKSKQRLLMEQQFAGRQVVGLMKHLPNGGYECGDLASR
jgi:hypothetical protein